MEVKIVILGFNNPKVIEDTFTRLFEHTDLSGVPHEIILVDCCYPLPNRAENKQKLKRICERTGATYLPLIKNFGQDGNYNKVFFQAFVNPDTLLLYFDPDNLPERKDYLKTAIRLQEETQAGYITLHRHHPQFDMRTCQGPLTISPSGIRYRNLHNTGGWPMALWSGDFITKMRPMVQSHSYYGGTENNIYEALKRTGFQGIMLEDYEDKMISCGHDKEYVIWKAIVINSQQHEDFEEWLTKYRLIELLAPVSS